MTELSPKYNPAEVEAGRYQKGWTTLGLPLRLRLRSACGSKAFPAMTSVVKNFSIKSGNGKTSMRQPSRSSGARLASL